MVPMRKTSLLSLASVVAITIIFTSGCDERDGANVDPIERAELQHVFAEARKLDEAGRYHEALVRYETILARRPNYMSTRLNAGMAAYDSGQYEKATQHFLILHKAGPGDWFVIRKLIQCYERLDKPAEVKQFRTKLDALRSQKDGSLLLKRYEGLTRDYVPMGSMHLIGYEFFEPKKHGRLWFFHLEDRERTPVSAFLLEATPFHDNSGKRMFSLTEASFGWLRIWYVGAEGRDYKWTRDYVMECLQGKRQPLLTRPLPPEYEALVAPISTKPPPDGEPEEDSKDQ